MPVGKAYLSDGPLCYHPEYGKFNAFLRRGTSEPCNMIKLCDCGANVSCPACGWGYGAMPCACLPAPKQTFWSHDLSLDNSRALQLTERVLFA